MKTEKWTYFDNANPPHHNPTFSLNMTREIKPQSISSGGSSNDMAERHNALIELGKSQSRAKYAAHSYQRIVGLSSIPF